MTCRRRQRSSPHDLDATLDSDGGPRSFATYKEYLTGVAVPLLHGTFEELDDESANYLQLFFRVHRMAVRMVVARWTRGMLLAGRQPINKQYKGIKDRYK